jgi:site-specific DNA-methyltransferase (adenine-specific)
MYLSVNEIHEGDARELLSKIEPDSVALSFWSPPYHLGKDYEKQYTYEQWLDLLKKVIHLHLPIIKPGGFLVVNIADILAFPDETMPRIQALNLKRQKSSVTKEDVLAARAAYPHYNRYQLAKLLGCSEQTIDRRLNGNNIRGGKSSTQTRIHLVSGIIEEFGSAAGFYLYDRRIWVKDATWENSKWHTLSYRSVDEFEYLFFFWKPGITVVDRNKLTPKEWGDWGSRGVWNIRSVRANNDHEAKFPIQLPQRTIKLLTAPDDIVIDCFMGSGTTAIAALREGRKFIGIELERKYVNLARKSVAEEFSRGNLSAYDQLESIHHAPKQLRLIKEKR